MIETEELALPLDAASTPTEDARKGECMFYLGGSEFPATTDQLITAVTEGFAKFFTLPSTAPVAKMEGDYPAFTRVAIDLTSARSNADKFPPEPKSVDPTRPGVFTARLEVEAHPLYIRQAAVELSLTAANARFVYDRDAANAPMLSLADATDGRVTLAIKKPDLDALILTGAREAASKQGVSILEMNLALNQIDPRSIAVDVRVKVKKLFVTTTVTLRGKLTIDDQLNAGVSELSVTGEGMMGEMAAGTIRPKLQEVDGRRFPLTAMSLGQVKLRNVQLQAGETLRVTAAFGS
jgi:hypothetical protein